MRVMISIILMVIAALVGFFFGAAMGGAILLSMITGFACTISAIEKNKKE